MMDTYTVDDILLTTLRANGALNVSTLFGILKGRGISDVATRSAIWRLQAEGVIWLKGSSVELRNP